MVFRLTAIFLFITRLVAAQVSVPDFKKEIDAYIANEIKLFDLYEKEISKTISSIDTYWVVKKYNRQWMQGVYAFTGDTTKLIYFGRELELLSCDTNIYLVSPAYLRLDTIFCQPSIDGFLEWKIKNEYK